MSFRAVFADGPMAGVRHERMFMAPHIPERLWFIYDEEGPADGWLLVGISPRLEPDPPWPGQVEYMLDKERSDVAIAEMGSDWGTATYVHVP